MAYNCRIDYVDPVRCDACEMCIKSCPAGIFEIKEQDGRVFASVNKEKLSACTHCGECLKYCTGAAIVVAMDSIDPADIENCDACGKCALICEKGNFEMVEEDGCIRVHVKGKPDCPKDYYCSFVCGCGVLPK